MATAAGKAQKPRLSASDLSAAIANKEYHAVIAWQCGDPAAEGEEKAVGMVCFTYGFNGWYGRVGGLHSLPSLE